MRRNAFAHQAHRTGKWAFKGILFLLCLLILLLFFWRFLPPVSTLMLARFATFQSVTREWRPLEQISSNLALAAIVSEDAKFCSHAGIDWGALKEALGNAAAGKSARGASTIPMQVSKNLFLWPTRSTFRKGLEIPIALSMNAVWPKYRILEVYLNIAEWGPGIFGAEAASRAYFHKSAERLTLWEAALLAAALPNPALRRPDRPSVKHIQLAKNLILRVHASSEVGRCLNP